MSVCMPKPRRPMCQAQPIWTVWLLLGLAGHSAAFAQNQALNLITEPKGARGLTPPANVILSLDNSGSMSGTGIKTLRDSLKLVFSDDPLKFPDKKVLVQNGSIRLAWQSMQRCSGFAGWRGGCTTNGMKILDATHRKNFLTWVDNLREGGGTPSFSMFENAGNYLQAKNLGVNSPWASVPGKDATELPCLRNFHVFLTDGGYTDRPTNSNNADNKSRLGSLSGDKTYNPAHPQAKLYVGADSGMLADVAFDYWANDLRPDLADEVPAYWAPKAGGAGSHEKEAQDFGELNKPALLDPYWNPRNNPATWQHMVNYVIGFGSAANLIGTPTWRGSTHAGLGPLIRGSVKWPHVVTLDHWHAAINSRGKYFAVKRNEDLAPAFQAILEEVSAPADRSASAVSGSQLRLGAPGLAFVSRFDGKDWSGSLHALPIAANGDQSPTPVWDAGALLKARMDKRDRRLLTSTRVDNGGVAFAWDKLSESQKTALNGSGVDTWGEDRVKYLSGQLKINAAFRASDNIMGSVIGSVPLYVGAPGSAANRSSDYLAFVRKHRQRPATVYVGTSGGMLHAFDAATGQERMAYVPMGVYPKLHAYTMPNYQHQFMVDGSPFAADADLRSTPGNGAANWRTVVVGTLGLGGRGYFVLDGTQPDEMDASPVLLDRSAPGSTTVDLDIGHIASPPALDSQGDGRSEQIVKLNNQRWAVLLGNGVNSPNQRPVLLIQYLDGDRALKTIAAHSATGQGNGLGTPRAVDLDGNGTTDLVYAGDQKGQVWRFELLSRNDNEWTSSGVKKVFSGLTTQPIMVAPYWMPHPKGGVQIAFGTGRRLDKSDDDSQASQTLFGVRDNFTFSKNAQGVINLGSSTPVTTADQLVKQQVDVTRQGFSITTRTQVNYSTHAGWYMPLPLTGERLLDNPSLLQGRLVEFATWLPTRANTTTSCQPNYSSGSTYINYLDIISGEPPMTSLLTPIKTDPRYMANRYEGSGLRVVSRSLNKRRDTPINLDKGSTSGVELGFSLNPTLVQWRQLN